MSKTAVKERPILFSAPMVRALLEGRKTQTRRVVKWNNTSGVNLAFRGLTLDHSTPDRWELLSRDGDMRWNERAHAKCPAGKPGDLMRVKESAWMWCERRPNGKTKTGRPKWHYVPLESAPVFYVADGHKPSCYVVHPETGNEWGIRFKVGRFLPKWASRIALEITEVRVQRLQEISCEDALEEGVYKTPTWDGPEHMKWQAKMNGPQHTSDHANAMTDAEFHAAVEQTWAEYGLSGYAALWESINGYGSWAANPWVWAVSFKVVAA